MTAGCDAARVGVSLTRRDGEDIGPTDLRAAEFSVVFMGERERGGGSIGRPVRRSVRTSVGSGTVPAKRVGVSTQTLSVMPQQNQHGLTGQVGLV